MIRSIELLAEYAAWKEDGSKRAEGQQDMLAALRDAAEVEQPTTVADLLRLVVRTWAGLPRRRESVDYASGVEAGVWDVLDLAASILEEEE